MSRYSLYVQEDLAGQAISFDSKTGDMVIPLEGNYTEFDTFRSRLEGGDLAIAKKEYNRHNKYEQHGALIDHDPDPELDLTKFLRYGNSKHHLKFSVSLRANLKRKFKFYSQWEPYPTSTFIPDPILPMKKDRYGYDVPNGKTVKNWDDLNIIKGTERDRKWENKVFCQGYVYF